MLRLLLVSVLAGLFLGIAAHLTYLTLRWQHSGELFP